MTLQTIGVSDITLSRSAFEFQNKTVRSNKLVKMKRDKLPCNEFVSNFHQSEILMKMKLEEIRGKTLLDGDFVYPIRIKISVPCFVNCSQCNDLNHLIRLRVLFKWYLVLTTILTTYKGDFCFCESNFFMGLKFNKKSTI